MTPQSVAPVTPRADLVERALPFLPAGSEIRRAFIGQAAPNFFYFIVTYLTGLMFRNKYRCVVVTPEAIPRARQRQIVRRRETSGNGGADAEKNPARSGLRPLGGSVFAR